LSVFITICISKIFLSAAKGAVAVAIARYYFYSGTAAVVPLLNLTNSGNDSDAINKVAVAHLCRQYVLVGYYGLRFCFKSNEIKFVPIL